MVESSMVEFTITDFWTNHISNVQCCAKRETKMCIAENEFIHSWLTLIEMNLNEEEERQTNKIFNNKVHMQHTANRQ